MIAKTEAHSDEDDLRNLEPVHERDGEEGTSLWTRRLILFLRVMAGFAILKGLYHWSRLVGIGMGGDTFEYHSIAWQTATVFFAVLDLVAAVGLWLAAAWGAVIWLMSVASMLALEVFFPQVFGASLIAGLIETALLCLYLLLALKAAQEHPP
jgi:fatty acid desaturase